MSDEQVARLESDTFVAGTFTDTRYVYLGSYRLHNGSLQLKLFYADSGEFAGWIDAKNIEEDC